MPSDDIFSKHAGQTQITGVRTDKFGNPLGSEFDLAKDGAFKGFTIAVLHLYTGEGFDFKLPEGALKEKGFDIIRWTYAPPIKEFKEALAKTCQLWVISNSFKILEKEHIDEIKKYFESGHGIYIWGDNEPYYVDANNVAKKLFSITMNGNLIGNQTVSQQEKPGGPGFIPHLITTGLNFLYEGITIATIDKSDQLKPLLYGSASNLVSSVYEKNGKRAIVDGGFTRLFCHWDTAGSARYVKNAAAWLANYDQWGRDPHETPIRNTAGRIAIEEASAPVYYFLSEKKSLTVEGYWETEANVIVNVFDPNEEKVKEETINNREFSFDIEDASPGIWMAKLKIVSGPREKYSYVITICQKDNNKG